MCLEDILITTSQAHGSFVTSVQGLSSNMAAILSLAQDFLSCLKLENFWKLNEWVAEGWGRETEM